MVDTGLQPATCAAFAMLGEASRLRQVRLAYHGMLSLVSSCLSVSLSGMPVASVFLDDFSSAQTFSQKLRHKIQRAFQDGETRAFQPQRRGSSPFDDFIMNCIRSLVQISVSLLEVTH